MRWISVAVLAALSLGSAPRAQPAADAAMAKRLVGTWRLVSWVQRSVDGSVRPSPMSVGYLIYADVNRMCGVLADPRRPLWHTDGPGAVRRGFTPTAEEAISGINGLVSYCAAVEIHASEGLILHHVDVEKVPNNVGITRKRWVTFDGDDRMTLRVDRAELVPPLIESTLVWERVKSR